MRVRWDRNSGFCPSLSYFCYNSQDLSASGDFSVRFPLCSSPGSRPGSRRKHQKVEGGGGRQVPPREVPIAQLFAVLPVCWALCRGLHMHYLRKYTQIPWVKYDYYPCFTDKGNKSTEGKEICPGHTELVIGFGFKPGLSDHRTQGLRLIKYEISRGDGRRHLLSCSSLIWKSQKSVRVRWDLSVEVKGLQNP